MADTFKGIITADGKKRQLPYGAVLDRPVSDATLSKEGGFADSKAVGDKFAKVDSETASLKEDTENNSKTAENSFYLIRYIYLFRTLKEDGLRRNLVKLKKRQEQVKMSHLFVLGLM